MQITLSCAHPYSGDQPSRVHFCPRTTNNNNKHKHTHTHSLTKQPNKQQPNTHFYPHSTMHVPSAVCPVAPHWLRERTMPSTRVAVMDPNWLTGVVFFSPFSTPSFSSATQTEAISAQALLYIIHCQWLFNCASNSTNIYNRTVSLFSRVIVSVWTYIIVVVLLKMNQKSL